jgi:hypothetical protein
MTPVRAPNLTKLRTKSPKSAAEQRIEDLLGGASVLGRKLHGPLGAHELLLEGLPGKVSNFLANKLVVVRWPLF